MAASFLPSIAPCSTLSLPSSVSSLYSSSFLNSALVLLHLPMSFSQAYSTLLVSPIAYSCAFSSVPHLPSPTAIFPLSISALTSKLKCHPSLSFRQYLLYGFQHGFRIGFSLSRISRLQSASQNMQFALQNPQVMDEYLSCQVHLGRVTGPFPQYPLLAFHISRFGVMPKR